MKIPSSSLSSLRTTEEVVKDHTKDVTDEDSSDEGLIPRRIKRRGFGSEEYQLHYSTDCEEYD
jgi:hypothetical protein